MYRATRGSRPRYSASCLLPVPRWWCGQPGASSRSPGCLDDRLQLLAARRIGCEPELGANLDRIENLLEAPVPGAQRAEAVWPTKLRDAGRQRGGIRAQRLRKSADLAR